MPKESESTEQIMSEIKALRRQAAELRGIEQRCQQAEAALKAFDKRNRLLGDSAQLGIFIFERPGFYIWMGWTTWRMYTGRMKRSRTVKSYP